MDIAGSVAIVTGASSGIGRATAQALTALGGRVALVARSADVLDALARALPDALAVPADMTDEAAIRAMVAKVDRHYGRIDILVNNAGQGYGAPIHAIDPTAYRRLIELNVIGPLVAMQAVIPVMRRGGSGAIVNISSGTSLMALPHLAAYSSTKRALNALSLTAAAELAADGIAVSLLHPYITRTRFGQGNGAPDDPNLPPPDTAEHVAGRIVAMIQTGEREGYAHPWMAGMREMGRPA